MTKELNDYIIRTGNYASKHNNLANDFINCLLIGALVKLMSTRGERSTGV